MTTDPTGTTEATGLTGQRLMGTGSTSPEPWLLILLKPEPQPMVLLVQHTGALVLVVTEPWPY